MTSTIRGVIAIAALGGAVFITSNTSAQVFFGPPIGVRVGVGRPPFGPPVFMGPPGPVVVASPFGPAVGVYGPAPWPRGSVRVEVGPGRYSYRVDADAPDFVGPALASLAAGRYTQALATLAPVMADDPRDGYSRAVAAQAQFALGHYGDSSQLLHEALPLLPEEEWGTLVARFWETFGSKDRYTNSLRKLEAHLKQQPDDAAARFVLGYQYAYLGHHAEAVKQLEQSLQFSPGGDPLAERLVQMFDARPAAEELPAPEVAQPDADQAAELREF